MFGFDLFAGCGSRWMLIVGLGLLPGPRAHVFGHTRAAFGGLFQSSHANTSSVFPCQRRLVVLTPASAPSPTTQPTDLTLRPEGLVRVEVSTWSAAGMAHQ